MKLMMVAATVAMMGAWPAFAQNYGTQDDRTTPSLRAQPPAGAYQGYFESRDRPPEQTAEVPSAPRTRKDPGTLTKFNSNSGYGPEVQFEVDRRAAQQQKLQEQQMGR